MAILEVLALKAKENQSYKSELVNTYKVFTKRSVDEAMKSLLVKRMVFKVTNKRRSTKGNAADLYEISTYGLLFALYYQRRSEPPLYLPSKHEKKVSNLSNDKRKIPILWKEIHKLAGRHKEKIPLIFGKWELFRKQGWIDLVVSSMRAFFEDNQDMPSMLFQQETFDVKPVFDDKGGLTFETFMPEEKVQFLVSEIIHKLTLAVIFPKPTHPLDYTSYGIEISGWEKTLRNDDDLKKFIRAEVAHRQLYCQNELRQLELWKDFLA